MTSSRAVNFLSSLLPQRLGERWQPSTPKQTASALPRLKSPTMSFRCQTASDGSTFSGRVTQDLKYSERSEARIAARRLKNFLIRPLFASKPEPASFLLKQPNSSNEDTSIAPCCRQSLRALVRNT